MSPVENPHRRTSARVDSTLMIGRKKFEVNIWSDQLTGDFESSILSWSDQIRV